jgi:hypothetical protein
VDQLIPDLWQPPPPDSSQPPPDASVQPDQSPPPPDQSPPPPDQGPPPPDTGPTGLTAPFFLDFEKDNGGLVGNKDWEWGQLAFKAGTNCDGTPTPPTAALSGTRVWGTKLNDCYSPLGNASSACANASKTDDSVLTLSFTIPASLTDAYLVYWEWTDYFLNFDWSEVYVQGTVTRQHCTGGYTKPTNWVRRVLNLKQQIGKKVTVEFHFMATTVVQYAGWYIDNLSVTDKAP